MALLKNNTDLRALREAGRITSQILLQLGALLTPGISTMALEEAANRILSSNRSTAPFKSFEGFNHAVCVSINDEIVNGPPSRERLIAGGDLVSIATAAEHRGIHAKAARTFFVGKHPDVEIERLLKGTETVIANCLQVSSGCRTLNELLRVIPKTAEKYGLTIVRDLGGAGIGKKLHDAPLVPNRPEDLDVEILLPPGLAFTIMPMFTLGESPDFHTHEDGWTYITADHALSAHFADTVLMTETGLVNITNPVSE